MFQKKKKRFRFERVYLTMTENLLLLDYQYHVFTRTQKSARVCIGIQQYFLIEKKT